MHRMVIVTCHEFRKLLSNAHSVAESSIESTTVIVVVILLKYLYIHDNGKYAHTSSED